MSDAEIFAVRAEERKLCVKLVEKFAVEYVHKWIGTQGDKAKAEGWAILQAAAALAVK